MSSKTDDSLKAKLLRDQLEPLETALAETRSLALKQREMALRANSVAAGWMGFSTDPAYREALALRDADLKREISGLNAPEAEEALASIQAMSIPPNADTCRVFGKISGDLPRALTIVLVKQAGGELVDAKPNRLGQYLLETRCPDEAATLEIRDGEGRLLMKDGKPVPLQAGETLERNYKINRCGEFESDRGREDQAVFIMPDLVGMPVSEARQRLPQTGNYPLILQQSFDNAPKDQVIAQGPKAGLTVKQGEAISLTISRGSFFKASQRMPSLIGITTASARKLLNDLQFKSLAIDYVDAPESIDKVVQQKPPAEAPLEPDAQILLCVGQAAKTMPDVVGKTEADARVILVPEFADFINVTYVRSEREPGIVTAQDPKPETAIAKGSKITIEVSMPLKERVQRLMPNLIGLSEKEAETRISDLGNFPVESKEVANPIPKGLVFSQSPAAGVPLKPGDPIRLEISAGREQALRMPNLVGLVEAQARQALIPKYASEIKVTYSNSIEPGGTVIKQSVKAGDQVPAGTPILIEVAEPTPNDRKREIMPDVTGLTLAQAQEVLAEVGMTKLKYDTEEAKRRSYRVVKQRPESGRVLKGNETAVLKFGPKN
jgi:beta-lactam-binding protein with PASTA domain